MRTTKNCQIIPYSHYKKSDALNIRFRQSSPLCRLLQSTMDIERKYGLLENDEKETVSYN